MSGPDQVAATKLAAAVLHHARRDQWDLVNQTVGALHDRHGSMGIRILILGLADTVIAAQGGPSPAGSTVQPVWINSESLTQTAVNDVPAGALWAGRFIAARAADDEATCQGMVMACTNGEEFRDCVAALLVCAATTLNDLQGAP